MADSGARECDDSEPVTPLHDAAQAGDLSTLQRLLAEGAECNEEDWRGTVPLYWAVESGVIEAVQFLLESGANPDGNRFVSPLIRAAELNRIDMLRILIEYGANPCATSPSDGETALMPAACHGNLEMVDLLLQLGVSPNVVARKGLTALGYATERGHVGIAQRLRDAGAEA